MVLEIGKVCMKVAGREAGKYCVVLKKLDDTFVLVTGPKELTGVKRRRCNIEHLEPTSYSLKIDPEASDDLVIKAYDAIGLTKKLSLRLPSPEVIKEFEKKAKEIPKKPEAEKKPKKEEKKAEEKPKEEVKKPEEKKGLTLKLKLPSLGKKKEKVEKKPEKPKKSEKKPEKTAEKKVEKKAKKKK
jgi:large subunit ribosomal protein L14e